MLPPRGYGQCVVRPPKLVLFDLGGVLIELRGVATMAELSGIDDEGELWRRWLQCRWVRIFESGGCTPGEIAPASPTTGNCRSAPTSSWRSSRMAHRADRRCRRPGAGGRRRGSRGVLLEHQRAALGRRRRALAADGTVPSPVRLPPDGPGEARRRRLRWVADALEVAPTSVSSSTMSS